MRVESREAIAINISNEYIAKSCIVYQPHMIYHNKNFELRIWKNNKIIEKKFNKWEKNKPLKVTMIKNDYDKK